MWEVVTDLARYPEWNPFVIECRSTLAVGAPIDMRVRLLPPRPFWQREEILAHEPGRRLCYGLRGAFAGGLASERCHVVTARGDAGAHYASTFALRGPLAPVVAALLGRRLARGFAGMTQALAQRAEALATAARATP